MGQVLGFLVTIAEQIIISQVIGIVYQAAFGVRNQPDAKYSDGSIKETTRSTSASLPVLYGRNFVGGNEVFMETYNEENKTLYVIQTMSEGEIKGIARLNADGSEAVSLITNGDCELLTGWTTVSGTTARSSTQKHGGTYSWSISNNSVVKSNNMSWTSGDILTFEFWLYVGHTSTLYGYAIYDADGTTILASTNLGYNSVGWHFFKLSGAATKTGSLGRIQVSNLNSYGTIYIDDVSFYNRAQQVYLDDKLYSDFNTDIVAFGQWSWGDWTGFTINQKFGFDVYSGTATQVYPEYLHTLNAAYLDNMRYTAYVVFKFEYDPDLYNSLPSRTFIVEGRLLYDFRNTTTSYSRNGVLALYDYMTNTRYGLGFSSAKFDTTSWTSAANYIDNKNPTGKWYFDYAVTSGQASDIIDTILRHIRCELVEYAGVFYLYYYDINTEASSLTLTDADIVRDESGKVYASIAETDINELPDGYKVSFSDGSKLSATDSIQIGDSQGYIKQIDLYGCSSRELAFELGSYYFERELLNRHITGTFRDRCQQLQKHDIVTLTSTVLGVTSATLRVVSTSIRSDGCVDLDLIYESTDLYNTTYDSEIDDVYETTIPNDYDQPGVISDATGSWSVTANASYSGSIAVSWTSADFVYAINVWISTDNVTYKLYASGIRAPQFNIDGLGSYYDYGNTVYIKLQSVSEAGVASTLPASPQITVTINSPIKWAGFFVGQYDLWGGNSSISHANTTIVLGNLDGVPKLALGGSADLMTLTNVANYAGFYADGTGSFRHGSNNAYGIFDVGAGTYTFHGVTIASDCSVVVSGTTVDTFTINSDANDADISLVFGRTTGGNASIMWNGTGFTMNKSTTITGNANAGNSTITNSMSANNISGNNGSITNFVSNNLRANYFRMYNDASNYATFQIGTSGVSYTATANLFQMAANVQQQADTYAKGTTGWRVSYAGDADFRYLYVDEMHAKAFIADLEQALAGGQIITKSVAKVAANFALPAANASANMDVEEFAGFTGQVFANSDIVQMRQFTRNTTGLSIASAWGTVSYVSRNATDNPPTQRYTFTRSGGANAGTASGNIGKGTLALDYGTSNGGIWEVSAFEGDQSPYAAVKIWETHPANGMTFVAEMGQLGGTYGYATSNANTCGFALGRYANNSSFMTIETLNGIRMLYKNATGVDTVTGQWYMNGMIKVGSNASQHIDITSSNITIFGSTANNYSTFDSAGVNIYYANNSVAAFGSTLRIGEAALGHLTVSSSGMNVYSNTTNVLTSFTGTALTFYQPGTANAVITINSGGNANINLLEGSDITFKGNNTNPAKLSFVGSAQNSELYASTTGSTVTWWPVLGHGVNLSVGEGSRIWKQVIIDGLDINLGGYANLDDPLRVASLTVRGNNTSPLVSLHSAYDSNNYANIVISGASNNSSITMNVYGQGSGNYATIGAGFYSGSPRSWLAATKSNVALTVVLDTSNNFFFPYPSNSIDLGNATYYWRTSYANYTAYKGGGYFDEKDDVSLLRNMNGTGMVDPITGLESLDTSSLPHEVLMKHREDKYDSQNLKIANAGDIEVDPADGKPWIDGGAFIGLIRGGIVQLAGKYENNMANINLGIQAILARLDKLEGK
jgi:hypothetical protein